MVEAHSSNFRVIITNFLGVRIFRKFTVFTIHMYDMSHVTRKSVFGVCDQLRLKPVYSATETSYSLEIARKETRDIILSKQ